MSKQYDAVFSRIIINLFGVEGGFQKNPNDPGNYRPDGTLVGTKYGISARSYPHLDIPNLTLEEATEIYYDDFWKKLGCQAMPLWLAEFAFDFAVNSGVGYVARRIQRAVGVLDDGIVGPRTIAAISQADPRNVLRLLFVARARTFAETDPANYKTHCSGWFARLFDKTCGAILEAEQCVSTVRAR
jgi:lysozyme family protein